MVAGTTRPKRITGDLGLKLELIAYVYHWQPAALYELDLDEVEVWAGFAEQRLKSGARL
mgnify:CR=1 FL=1